MLPALKIEGEYKYDVEKELEDIWVVDTLEELEILLGELYGQAKRNNIVSFDTETSGINPKEESPAGKGYIVTAQVAWIEEAPDLELKELCRRILADEVDITKAWIDCRDPRMLHRLKEWLEDEDCWIVMQGGAYDRHVAANHGIYIKGCAADTLGMSRLQYPERKSHSLDGSQGLVKSILGKDRYTTKQALGVHKISASSGNTLKGVEFRDMRIYVDDEEMRPYQQVYSVNDVDDCICLKFILELKLREMEWDDDDRGLWGFWEDHLCGYGTILFDIERQGICIDEGVLQYLLTEYRKLERSLTEESYEIIGVPINLNSYQHKGWMLYGKGNREFARTKKKSDGMFMLEGWELPCRELLEDGEDPWVKKKKWDGSMSSGYPSTDGDHLDWTLERIEHDSDEAQCIRILKSRQEVQKLISATLEPLERNLRERHQTGVREAAVSLEMWRHVHGTFSVAARTGRLSCVAGWTPVRTRRGDVPIDTIGVGDFVWTHKGSWRRVTHTWIKGVEEMFSVFFASGDILTCTRSHRILASNGLWVTVGELLDGTFSKVGKRYVESGTCENEVPINRVLDNTGDSGSARDELSQCQTNSFGRYSYRGEEGASKSKVFPIENGGQEPDEREKGKESPQLAGGLRRWLWVSDSCVQGKASVCTSHSDDEVSRDQTNTEGHGCSSHRRRSIEQQLGQLGVSNEKGAPRNSFPGEGQSVNHVEKIVSARSLEVYDITVDEDGSYLACGVFSHNSSKPNLQQIPSRTKLGKAIRHAFICEPEQALLVADYSQLELNILSLYIAEISDGKDMSYAQALRDGDIHQRVADSLGISRRDAKPISFGPIYGMTAYKLRRTMQKTLEEAQEILDNYFADWPGVQRYMDWAVRYAHKFGTARTILGRYRQLPNIHDVYRGGRAAGRPTRAARADERRALNTPIQGSAQDIVGTGQIHLADDEELLEYGYKQRLVVHDEVVGTCIAKYREQALKRKVYLMENAITWPEYGGLVKTPVEGFSGANWGESKDGLLFSCPRCEGTGKRGGDKCLGCAGEGAVSTKQAAKTDWRQQRRIAA